MIDVAWKRSFGIERAKLVKDRVEIEGRVDGKDATVLDVFEKDAGNV